MKRWDVISKLKIKNKISNIDEIIDLILENRGIKTEEEKKSFLDPKLEEVTPQSVGIKASGLKKAIERISEAIEKKEQIVVYGDYDVDGITGSGILWETLDEMGAKVMPYIPDRLGEGYGLSLKGISNLRSKISDIKLIITVDNGIVAKKAVDFANEQGIDVIITDHHTLGAEVPDAHAIVHTTKLCGAGVAYLLSKELRAQRLKIKYDGESDRHLELAALGTVADLVPLNGGNRAIVKHGIDRLAKTRRLGLLELYKNSGLVEKDIFSVYELGFIIAPRLNAAGRIDSAMDSLRLLCTRDRTRAAMLAEKLELTNRERQLVMKQSADHAKSSFRDVELKNLLFIADPTYQQGVIGLVAGKLVEEFYRPSIVVSKGEKLSKGSVRSVAGFNIIEFLRSHMEYFIDLGGHPMAAGFTVETEKIPQLQKALETSAEKALTEIMLMRYVKADCELPLSLVTTELYFRLRELEPFGMGNPEPTFVSRGAVIEDKRLLGKDSSHLKMVLRDGESVLSSIGFGMGELASDMHVGDKIDLVYSIDQNVWNGRTSLQLKLKDIQAPKS